MKKKLLPLAMLAGLAGAAGTAQAVYLNGDGLGEALIYPYYTVTEGQNTYINITNTTPYYKAVKVRFLEGMNSQEVLDFNLYLSPEDIWTGAVVPTADGAKLITRDNSCTVPKIPRLNDEGEGYDGADFRNSQYDEDGGPTDLGRTREGYVEVLEMGAIIDPTITAMIRHDAGGIPGDCDGLRERWLTLNATPTASTRILYDDPDTVEGNGAWLTSAQAGFATDGNMQSVYMLGGLYGYGVLINPSEGSGSAYNAKALDQWRGAIVGQTPAYSSNHSNPGSVDPSLGGEAAPIAQIINGNNVVEAFFDNGWDAVSSVFMHATVSNDFVLEPAVAGDTDWVLTMPTKRQYVNVPDPEEGEAEALPPFTAVWPDACEEIELDAWDREEAVTELTGDIDFSPRPDPGEDPEGLQICTEVSVLSFGDATAVYPSENVRYGVPDLGHVNGWARINFAADTSRVLSDTFDEAEFYGLPVTGFAVQKFINGSMEGGTLANYAWLTEHSYTRDIQVSD